MADDTRDFVEQTQSRAIDLHGREFSADELAADFARLDLNERSEALQRMRAGDNEKVYANPREAARDFELRTALTGMHDRLRKAGR